MCRFFFVAPAALSQMKDINQENHGESIVRHHGNEIVDGCDERAGSHSRINVKFMEKHGNYRAHKAGNNHRYNERNADTAGQQKGLSPIVWVIFIRHMHHLVKKLLIFKKHTTMCFSLQHFLQKLFILVSNKI